MNNVNMNNSTSFAGGFYFKTPNTAIKEAIPNLIKKGRQIFYDLQEKGDVFLVTRDKDDKKVIKFIKDKNLSFEFYPRINTSRGLDTEVPEPLKQMMKKERFTRIKDIKSLKLAPSRKGSLSDSISTIANSLRLNIERPQVAQNDATLTTIRDSVKQRNINVILTQGNTYYVEVVPDIKHDSRTLAILQSDGTTAKICTDLKDRISFLKKFQALKLNKDNVLYQYKIM